MRRLDKKDYTTDDVVGFSKYLIGKVLVTKTGPVLTSGIITETEAYKGTEDKACHAFGGKRTARNERMYHEGGLAYIYLCYGIHHLFNVVTNSSGIPDAVLIRSVQPLDGIEEILLRRNAVSLQKGITTGPGKVTQALGIHTSMNGESLLGRKLWIEDRGIIVPETDILTGTRIGVDYAGEDALRPYRFYMKKPVSLPGKT